MMAGVRVDYVCMMHEAVEQSSNSDRKLNSGEEKEEEEEEEEAVMVEVEEEAEAGTSKGTGCTSAVKYMKRKCDRWHAAGNRQGMVQGANMFTCRWSSWLLSASKAKRDRAPLMKN